MERQCQSATRQAAVKKRATTQFSENIKICLKSTVFDIFFSKNLDSCGFLRHFDSFP